MTTFTDSDIVGPSGWAGTWSHWKIAPAGGGFIVLGWSAEDWAQFLVVYRFNLSGTGQSLDADFNYFRQ
jgi:hypothetical protein